MKLATLNQYLSRALVLFFFLLFGGLLQVVATDVTGFEAVSLSGDLNATSALYYNNSLGDVPRGAIILFNGSCPSGWTYVSTHNTRYMQAASSYGSTGTSDHTHSSTHTHTETLALAAGTHNHQWAYAYSSTTTSSDGSHSHTMTGCGLTWTTPAYGVVGADVYDADNAGTDTEAAHYHEMGWDDYGTDSGSHSHTISGSISTSADSSSSGSITPEYYDLVFCMKW